MLDFSQVAAQMDGFTRDHADSRERLLEALKEAGNRLRNAAPRWEEVQSKIADSRTSWLMPDWRERPDQIMPLPGLVEEYTALATDGSQIVADRHDALCYLINVGYITLRYGARSSASLRSRPVLATPDDTLLSEYHGDQDPIAPARLAMHRRMQEIAGLVEFIAEEAAVRTDAGQPVVRSGGASASNSARTREERSRLEPLPVGGGWGAADAARTREENWPGALPMVALCDGSLILWPLETERKGDYRVGVLRSFQASLDAARIARAPVAGYISQPMSKDVVNSLRVSVCPFDSADCDHNCPKSSLPKPHYIAPACAGTERVTDAALFAELLQPGERSAVFRSGSKILKEYAPRHRIGFFYLHTGREVARIEIPAWVADDPALLAQTHALCFDQACKGDGYPVALAEAHEQAIVRGAERAAFFHLMERHFVAGGQPIATTQKALSKRARRV